MRKKVRFFDSLVEKAGWMIYSVRKSHRPDRVAASFCERGRPRSQKLAAKQLRQSCQPKGLSELTHA
jgi:hypothetical protein